ncbi:MAG: SRPBCC family protein [Planctomycetota bacterium]|nr:SRPBCC family protein [Planctomycetota bacterium]
MKPYTVSIDIDLPRDLVIELFDNEANLVKWQTGLQSFERLSGEPGQPGATSKLVFLNGKREFELIETVTANNLPDSMEGTYEWSGGGNTLQNRFIELNENHTRWESTCQYHFKGIMLRLMGLLASGFFRKQNLKFMRNFKAFAEHGHDVRQSGDAPTPATG